ncbi:hypothetical protein CSOJ01_11008 [Colletotrichum sojae]|uniref:Uncharacterized protein n=1 Tax=Colletotrichum sojae TaxID=2175907 RepID=A0A8H6IYN0_9PEZI|nr:hypothetical protein CSOJ01_11008 [Colletotrichum sojae]
MDFHRPNIASPDAAVSKNQTPRLWQALPAEIRNMIFDCAKTTIPPTSKEGVGSWARVAKEWRSVFLPVLWHTLTFQPSNPSADFRGFTEFLVKGQCRPLIKRVVLHVSLAPDGCDECDQEECETTISSNNRAFADHVTAGFEHLSKWPAVESRTDRITLELRVNSPSDAQHMFATSGGRCARSEEAGYSETGAARRMLGYHLRRQSRDALGHFLNIWENPLHVLRLAGIVDGFSVNRSTLRIIDSRAMWTMLKAMPNLKSVNYEPWAHPLSYEEVEHRNKTNADFFLTCRRSRVEDCVRCPSGRPIVHPRTG